MFLQGGAYTRAQQSEKLLAPLCPVHVGGEAMVTNDWCIKTNVLVVIFRISILMSDHSIGLYGELKISSSYNHIQSFSVLFYLHVQ